MKATSILALFYIHTIYKLVIYRPLVLSVFRYYLICSIKYSLIKTV